MHEQLEDALTNNHDDSGDVGRRADKSTTQFQLLCRLFGIHFTSFIDEDGDVLVTQSDRDPGIAIPLTGSAGLKGKIRMRFMETHDGRSPAEIALTQLVSWVEAATRERAQASVPVYVRIGQEPGMGVVWIDLGWNPPRYVRITDEGWTIEDRTTVLFRRPYQTRPLPEPVLAAEPWSLEDALAYFINVEPEDRQLLVATIASGLLYRIPHPIVAFDGPHGSAKTFASRIFTRLLDPTAGHQRVPSNPQDLLAGAKPTWVYALDNLTFIPDWLANDLCGLVTGYRSDSRKLYTNDELHSVSLRRVVLLSSTHYAGVARSDLVERTLFFRTPHIGEDRRIAEEDLEARFAAVEPFILGGLCSMVSAGLRGMRSSVVQDLRLPRMADFGRFLAALDHELGGERFMRYRQKVETGVRDALGADRIGEAILQFVQNQEMTARPSTTNSVIDSARDWGEWRGTATEFYELLTDHRPGVWPTPMGGGKGWPQAPNALVARLKGIEPSLRANGIYFDRERSTHQRSLIVRWDRRLFRSDGTNQVTATPA